MNERHWGFGVAAILAISACNVLVGVEDVQLAENTGGTGGVGGVAGAGGAAGAGGMGGTGGAGECSESNPCMQPPLESCRVKQCMGNVCVEQQAAELANCGYHSQCDIDGVCIKNLGAPCGDMGASCASGFCVDGVCCENECTEVCHACNAPGENTIGHCIPLSVGLDDHVENGDYCEGVTTSCAAMGTCKGELGSTCAQDINCFSNNCVSIPAGQFCLGPSARDLPSISTCGPDQNTSCNELLPVPGGYYWRMNDPAFPAQVHPFFMDRYEITVGRFRQFFKAFGAGPNGAAQPKVGSGAHPRVLDSGWLPTWTLPNSVVMEQQITNCDGDSPGTWTSMPMSNENLPMSCVSWYEAFAFCAWEGGRLPTDAEWNFAAASAAQRVYPWSFPPSSTTISASNAVYDCNEAPPGAPDCILQDIRPVGSKSMNGNGPFLHSDLSGSMAEWTRDVYAPPKVPCVDCIELGESSNWVVRGGGWDDNSAALTTSSRKTNTKSRSRSIGFRCVYDLHPQCGNGVVDPDEYCDDNSLDPAVSSGCKDCDKIKKVVTGETHACVLTHQGKLKCWGDNQFGQCGQGSSNTIQSPADYPFIPLPGEVADVALSQGRTCALLKSGAVECFGNDRIGTVTGLLGTKDPVNEPLGDNPAEIEKLSNVPLTGQAMAIASGQKHTCVILSSGNIRCWGDNSLGQLGIGNTSVFQGPASVNVLPSSMKAMALTASDHSTCALLMDGSVACWGANTWSSSGNQRFGVLGIDDSTETARGDMPGEMSEALLKKTILPMLAPIANTLTSHANGHCYFDETSMSVRCWGENNRGQLGQENTDDWGGGAANHSMSTLAAINLGKNFIPAQIAAGRTHTCVVSTDGRIKCFGTNDDGELGLGIARTNASIPAKSGIGDTAGEMGDALAELNLGNDRAKQISLGNRLTCALFTNNRVKCWGRNNFGQTGVLPADPAVGDDLGVNMMPMPQHVKDLPYVDPL